MDSLATLCETVQHNCNISDARYARDYSMCVYLLRMQEHYRWKKSIRLSDPINREALGIWVRATEEYWDTIEEEDYQPLHINGESFSPFDAENINRTLSDSNLAYSAGIGRLGQPHFVLAERTALHQHPYPKIELGNELARDSITLPAMAQDGTIIIRHAGIRQMFWQMLAEWRLRKNDGPMARVVEHYCIDPDTPDEKQIAVAAKDLSKSIVDHERGEIIAGELLGQTYQEMIAALQGHGGEGYARAVRDLLADAHITWPNIVEQQNAVFVDFWLAGLQGIRESLLQPTAFFCDITQSNTPLKHLNSHIKREQQRWYVVASVLLDTFRTKGVKADFKSVAESAVLDSEQHA